jgi:hypothetical protein
MQIIAVNDRQFTADIWTGAIANAKGATEPIHLLIKQGGWYGRLDVAYHDGLKYPHLERIPGTIDMLAAIMAPHVIQAPTK